MPSKHSNLFIAQQVLGIYPPSHSYRVLSSFAELKALNISSLNSGYLALIASSNPLESGLYVYSSEPAKGIDGVEVVPDSGLGVWIRQSHLIECSVPIGSPGVSGLLIPSAIDSPDRVVVSVSTKSGWSSFGSAIVEAKKPDIVPEYAGQEWIASLEDPDRKVFYKAFGNSEITDWQGINTCYKTLPTGPPVHEPDYQGQQYYNDDRELWVASWIGEPPTVSDWALINNGIGGGGT
ncbi:MAG: hypothetical protein F6J93_34335 [Oscillatoria sp. SIO1A7]|nr:hypothetical protein [Oscillatoria sp. SIO1A7]